MITETTAISCAAFGALSTGLGIAAGIGWMRCARLLAKVAGERNRKAPLAERYRTDWLDAIDAFADYIDSEPARISAHMREIGRKGNDSRIAKQHAAVLAKAAELQQNIADRAEPARIAA